MLRIWLAFAVVACTRPTPSSQPNACARAEGRGDAASETLVADRERAHVRIVRDAACRRTYELATTQPLRDRLPQTRTISEDGPVVRTNNIMFDALYALALAEAREASVSSIRDGSFNDNKPTPCNCFETGRLWTYVWTRDTSYATDLGLATIDPARARNSLEFKLSEKRGGGQLSIIQDTGSGGSWPISTDRVAWALGARALLRTLDGEARAAFAARALEALRNTIELDRAVVFDAKDGLYSGETSFLDWREQTYPPWTAKDTIHIGMSKALSTNALHVAALELGADLARERGDRALADQWAGWAKDLRAAIRRTFWLADRKMFAAFTSTFFDPAPSARYDLLATSLAVLLDIADAEQARAAIASYPQLPKGPPVVWPPERSIAVYHNRALWPFVTAYELRAARHVRNDRVATHAIESLVRGAALNLSNMENFEMVSGLPQTPGGPVINSQRQLWSVAGYVAMVHDVVFGIEPTGRGLRFAPYVTKALRNTMFRGATSLVLDGYPYRGRRLTITVRLPPAGGDGGAYSVGAVRVGGRVVTGEVPDAELASPIEIDLVDPLRTPCGSAARRGEAAACDRPEPAAAMRIVDPIDAPEMPTLTAAPLARGAKLTFSTAAPHTIYRDGVRVASAVTAREWIDRDAAAACWSAEDVDPKTGDVSHRSPPTCLFGDRAQHIPIKANDAEVRARFTGEHLIQLVASNESGPINTGVTCAVKHVTIEHVPDGAQVATGHIVMPHAVGPHPSSFVRARLVAGERYRVRIGDAPTALNMSSFEHFARYTGGNGGARGALNAADITELVVIAR